VTRSVILDTGRGVRCPLLAAHVTKREWILSLALTSFKEFIATLTTVVHRNYRFKIPWLPNVGLKGESLVTGVRTFSYGRTESVPFEMEEGELEKPAPNKICQNVCVRPISRLVR
jgi:hypothetical protein